ncbi:MAG: MBL fold metallo-hydrolase [Patescibacteria group bacterium]
MKLSKFQKIILYLTLIAGILLALIYLPSQKEKYLEVTTLDVGQGDAILIETPYGQNILIDGGPDNSVVYEVSRSLPFFERTIDLVILTHPDADHVTGLVEILRRYEVKKMLYTGVVFGSQNYVAFLKAVEKEGVEIGIVSEPNEINLGENLKLNILYPNFLANNLEFEDVNDTSVVAKLSYGQIDFILTGDAPIEIEKELLVSGVNLEAEVLKAGHHGSKTSSSVAFVQAVNPEYGVISVGKDNKFGHPNLRTLKTLETAGVKILQTSDLGDITFQSDGQNLWLKK